MTGFCWIASYPRSGNTWLRLALRALSRPDRTGDGGFAPDAAQRTDIEEALDIESSDLTPRELEALRPVAYRAMAATAGRPLYRKVHDARGLTASGDPLFPPDITLGTIYLVRDPRDVAVSWAHFARVGMDAAVEMLCDPGAVLVTPRGRPALAMPQRLLCWGGHVRSWLDAPGRAPCLIRYEDMLANPAAALRRAARYAGVAHDDDRLRQAVAATGFEILRGGEARHGFDGGQAPGSVFFRGGRSGDWRDELTGAQAARLWQAHSAVMTPLGYSLDG